MAQTQQKTKKVNQSTVAQKKSSYSAIFERMNSILSQYSNIPAESLYSAFGRAMGTYWANAPTIQNSRLKALNPLPCDYSKEDLNLFLTHPAESELPLQQVAEGLMWSNYSFFKTVKSYADMLSFHNYVIPQYITADDIKTDAFKREYRLVNKIVKAFNIKENGNKITMQALTQGKVFYVPRYKVDKSHNRCDVAFLQPLPKAWTTIIGQNNLSGWTVSFNLMYFLQPGTDYRQFGDLFEPYIRDFDEWVTADTRKAFKGKYIYASRNNEKIETEIKAWCQNGRFMYYVSLPIDRVWTFSANDNTAIVASPFAGLMQTYAQQADYEAAQLSLIMNPLIKIFTGEVPYYKANEAKEDNGYRMTHEAMMYFTQLWLSLMQMNNTGGTAMYLAPVENITSHDYPEAAGANDISKKFLEYGMQKSGLSALVPVTENPHQGTADYSSKLESQYAKSIYRTFEKMLNYILQNELSLKYSWEVSIFGDIYSDEQTRANCLKLIDKGSIYAYFMLAALDDKSLLDIDTMTNTALAIGFIDKLQVPPTSFTQSGNSQSKSDTGGAPTKTETERTETKIEKQTESATRIRR